MNSDQFRASWRTAILGLIAGLAAAALVGWYLDILFPLLTLVLAGCLVWQLRHLFRLHQWLVQRRIIAPPKGHGVWSSVYEGLHRGQRESRQRRTRLAAIVHEFREAMAALPDAVVVLDQDDRIRWFNSGAVELLGLDKKEDVGSRITHLIRIPRFERWLSEARHDPHGLIMEAPHQLDVKLRLRIFDYGDNEQQILMARDITDIQQAETMRKDFVANVSHELRSPLTVISGYLEIMSQATDEEWLPVVGKIEEQSDRMKSIVEDLLTLSRLDTTSELKDEEPVAMDALIEALVAEAQVMSAGNHRVQGESIEGVIIQGNAKDLRSAVTNLVANAVRYTPEGGLIQVNCQMNDGWATLSVKDDGLGIASYHLPRLTERFYRVSSDRSRASGGTGLGLAIVKHVVALHEARLEIQSELGHGSEFIIHFPPHRVSLHQSKSVQQSAS